MYSANTTPVSEGTKECPGTWLTKAGALCRLARSRLCPRWCVTGGSHLQKGVGSARSLTPELGIAFCWDNFSFQSTSVFDVQKIPFHGDFKKIK